MKYVILFGIGFGVGVLVTTAFGAKAKTFLVALLNKFVSKVEG